MRDLDMNRKILNILLSGTLLFTAFTALADGPVTINNPTIQVMQFGDAAQSVTYTLSSTYPVPLTITGITGLSAPITVDTANTTCLATPVTRSTSCKIVLNLSASVSAGTFKQVMHIQYANTSLSKPVQYTVTSLLQQQELRFDTIQALPQQVVIGSPAPAKFKLTNLTNNRIEYSLNQSPLAQALLINLDNGCDGGVLEANQSCEIDFDFNALQPVSYDLLDAFVAKNNKQPAPNVNLRLTTQGVNAQSRN